MKKIKKGLSVVLVLIITVAAIAAVIGVNAYISNKTPKEVVKQDIEEGIKLTIVDKTEPEEPAVPEPEVEIGKDYGDYYGKLSVDGTSLVGAFGQKVQLKGISSHGMSWYSQFISPESLATIHGWGVNTIRLAVYPSDLDGYCVGGEKNQQKLDFMVSAGVNAASINHMYAIIDWHTLNDADPNTYKAQAIEFFGKMSAQYKDQDNVIYEICNEPNGKTTWEEVCEYANEVIPVIRNNDPDAVIIVGTPNYCQDIDAVIDNKLSYDNILYSVHFYAASHGSALRDRVRKALEAEVPVIFSEFGIVSADGDGNVSLSSANEWMNLAKEENISTVMWNLSNKDEGSALISSDCEKLFGWEESDLTESGKWLLRLLDLGKANIEE